MTIDYNITHIEWDIDSYIDKGNYKRIVADSSIKMRKSGFFYKIDFEKHLPEFGWKIHISAVPSNALEILKTVSSYCIERKIPFKFLRDDEILKKTLSKPWDRSSSGKFITIYPNSETTFTTIVLDLYTILKNYIGPYILSDKRYKDCKVLYYRYGKIKDGKNKNNQLSDVIIGPNGEEYNDTPLPHYNQPTWVIDPFEDLIEENDENITGLKNGRYMIKQVIHMSNTGGVYLAFDNILHQDVVLKEARPFLNELNKDIDSLKLRKYEALILQELKGISGVPCLLDSFYEWEHYFISVNYIEGQTIQEFILSPQILGACISDKEKIKKRFIDIFIDIMRKVKDIHSVGVSIGDLSPFNILIDKYDKVHFLDFELAATPKIKNLSSTYMLTRGFRLKKISKDLSNRFAGDIEAVGLILLSFFHSTGSFFTLSPGSISNFISELVFDGILERDLALFIDNLIFNSNSIVLEHELNKLINIRNTKRIYHNQKNNNNLSESTLLSIMEELHLTIKNNIINTDNKLFNYIPSGTSKGLYTGDLGVLITLNKLEKVFKDTKTNELVENYLINNLDDCQDPNLYSGTAGLSYGLYKLSKPQKSFEMIDKTLLNMEKISVDYSVAFGVSGVGLVLLHLFNETRKPHLIEQAKKIGDKIANDFVRHDFNAFFNRDGKLELGFFNGLSGISYFLTLLYKHTENRRYLDISYFIIKKILSYAFIDKNNVLVPTNSTKEMYTSSLFGTGGLSKALFEINLYLKNDELSKLLDKLINSIAYKYINNPSLINGLSGNGLLLLEFYTRTGNEKYLYLSEQLLKSVLLFKYKNNNLTYFPESSLIRTNLNYSEGVAGILDFIIEFYLLKYTKSALLSIQ
ncbi:lanthionine synthetase LanC family protein [Bacillus sp. MUM 13]|uniref:class III lanthionine synthetase LanKC N-terminal domain-containing protein n=1 Tax=Bacillus sp. MUM 13 TaxID=1678001 RepID=UPI0008F5E102|nr:lanthionine synthetase LanC family protein [Bacillus sp. MUM 13]OIK05537.1 hypothetical protein BIV59_21720 [Bacillus sp. MUM 13]